MPNRSGPGGRDVGINWPCRASYSEGPGSTACLDWEFQRVSLNPYNKSSTLYEPNIAYFSMFSKSCIIGHNVWRCSLTYRPTNRPTHQPINQPTNQPTNQRNQPTNQPTNETNQPNKQINNQHTNQNNPPTNQTTNQQTKQTPNNQPTN